MNPKSLLRKITGQKQLPKDASQTPVIPGPALNPRKLTRPEPVRVSHHRDHPGKSMRRGIQIAKELKQRARRFAGIADSQRQGLNVRAVFRAEQLIDADVMDTLIHHSADYDGLFCREIAKRHLPGAQIIGWDFGQPLLPFPEEGIVYIMDLPPNIFEPMPSIEVMRQRVVWIDHHKSAIAKWDRLEIPGYRIDGVAACRLTWQFFKHWFALKEDFLKRRVSEPLAVTLAGEYDVWQHVNSKGADLTFQFGLDTQPEPAWDKLLSDSSSYAMLLIHAGEHAQACFQKRDADMVRATGFDLDFEGFKFIALNTTRGNSETFVAAVRPEHDGCLKFYWNGTVFVVSMYGVAHKMETDLSVVALKYGGGGHKQACGFQSKTLPWLA
jgi:hypothetical protein